MSGVFPFHRSINSLTGAFPAQSALLINHHQVIQPLLPAQITDLFSLQSVSRDCLQTETLPFTVIKPVEEVLSGVTLFPFFVV